MPSLSLWSDDPRAPLGRNSFLCPWFEGMFGHGAAVQRALAEFLANLPAHPSDDHAHHRGRHAEGPQHSRSLCRFAISFRTLAAARSVSIKSSIAVVRF